MPKVKNIALYASLLLFQNSTKKINYNREKS